MSNVIQGITVAIAGVTIIATLASIYSVLQVRFVHQKARQSFETYVMLMDEATKTNIKERVPVSPEQMASLLESLRDSSPEVRGQILQAAKDLAMHSPDEGTMTKAETS